MLTVYGRRSSINVQKVLWAVGELGLPHRRVDKGGDAGGLTDAAFLAMNPHGRVPVIDHDGVVVWESNTIIRYLASATGALWPGDAAGRSQADRWMDWSATALQPAFMDYFWGWYRTPEARRDHRRNAEDLDRLRRAFRWLDGYMESRRHLAMDAFTIGDIPAGTLLYRYFEMPFDRPDTPNLRRWYEALTVRPAYREHVMIPFGELMGRLAF